MIESKFQAARELIHERKYEEAKIILAKLNNPKAKAWIVKLDEHIADAEFQVALGLIGKGKYEEAKTILAKLNDPRARAWIIKLDERIKQQKAIKRLKTKAMRQSQIRKTLTIGNVLLITLFWGGAASFCAIALFITSVYVSPAPSYIPEGSYHDNFNRGFQLFMMIGFFVLAAEAFKRGWKRLTGYKR